MENKTEELEQNLKTAKSSLGSFIVRSPQSVIQPVVLQHQIAFSKRRYIDFLVPGIIGLVLMLSTLLITSLNLIRERNSGVYDRMQLSTTFNFNLIIPRIISHLIFSAVQLFVLMVISLILFGVRTEGSLLDTFFIGLLLSYPFIGIGLLLGFLTKSENTAILATLALSIPLMFLCGALFPFELMPLFMRLVGWAMPLTHGVAALRGVMIYGATLPTISQNLLIMVLGGTVPVLAAIWASKKHF
jgi:ABC-2 type transport system permease protein